MTIVILIPKIIEVLTTAVSYAATKATPTPTPPTPPNDVKPMPPYFILMAFSSYWVIDDS
jgi:hypothetical protein